VWHLPKTEKSGLIFLPSHIDTRGEFSCLCFTLIPYFELLSLDTSTIVPIVSARRNININFYLVSVMDWIFTYLDSWGYSLPWLTFLHWVHPYLYMWLLLRLQWLVLSSKEDHFELSLCKITMLRHTSDCVRWICWVSIGSMCTTVMFIFFSIMHVLCGTPGLPFLLPRHV
jgi:hypothetical protein